MIEVGAYNELEILRDSDHGLFLGDETGEDVLLPNKYCPENYEIGDSLRVYVYRDFAERKVATNLIPKIHLHEFALLRVSSVEDAGAFLDWGLEKELLVPFNEQRQRMEQGRWYVVYLEIDEDTDRLYASNRIEKRLSNEELTVKEDQAVDLLVYHKSELGYSVIVNNIHKGLIFNNEVFTDLNIGDKLEGFIKKIREENKLDISLQAIGYKKYNPTNSDTILEALIENKGFIPLTDKSPPEEIYTYFRMSKKAFKKAIGALYKQRKIRLDKKGIKSI